MKRIGAWAIGVAMFAALATDAKANIIINWQGTCTFGCIGTATGVLTLANSGAGPFSFDPGGPPSHSTADFISFSYTSSSGSFFLDNTPPGLYAQGYNVLPGSGFITFLESDEFGPQTAGTALFQFVVQDPNWQFLSGRYGDTCLNADCSLNTYDARDGGGASVFTRLASVPLTPSPIVNFLFALLAAGLFWLRRPISLSPTTLRP